MNLRNNPLPFKSRLWPYEKEIMKAWYERQNKTGVLSLSCWRSFYYNFIENFVIIDDTDIFLERENTRSGLHIILN